MPPALAVADADQVAHGLRTQNSRPDARVCVQSCFSMVSPKVIHLQAFDVVVGHMRLCSRRSRWCSPGLPYGSEASRPGASNPMPTGRRLSLPIHAVVPGHLLLLLVQLTEGRTRRPWCQRSVWLFCGLAAPGPAWLWLCVARQHGFPPGPIEQSHVCATGALRAGGVAAVGHGVVVAGDVGFALCGYLPTFLDAAAGRGRRGARRSKKCSPPR